MQDHTPPSCIEASWRDNFPRLAELKEAVSSTDDIVFYRNIYKIVKTSPLAREHYQEIESDLQKLNKSTWTEFKKKLLRTSTKPNGHRGYQQIQSALMEAKGYRILHETLAELDIMHDDIRLVPEDNNTKTPDWAAYCKGSVVGTLEVKTVFESDDNLKYIEKNTHRIINKGNAIVRRMHPKLTKKFIKKIKSTVNEAHAQLDSWPPNKIKTRIALLIIFFNHELTGDESNYSTISSLLDEPSNCNITIKHLFKR